jgi:O-antigen/teichoic acid export membrane protein
MNLGRLTKRKSEFTKNVMLLVAGSGTAQIIGILVAPLLARLYTPEDFGVSALFLSISSLLLVLSSGRYEMAIVQAKTRLDALSLIFVSMLISICILIPLFILILVFESVGYINELNGMLAGLLALIPCFVFLMLLCNSIANYINRQKKYKKISQVMVYQSLFQASSKLLLGWVGVTFNGLLLGTLVGQLSAAILYLISFFKSNINKKVLFLAFYKVKESSYNYRAFPKYMLLSDSINVVSIQMPILLTGLLFSQGQLGLLAMAISMTSIPLRFIGGALSRVFRQEAAAKYNRDGECEDLFLKMLKKVSLLLIAPFTVVFFLSPSVFSVVFGKQWAESGEIVQVMLPMFYFQFISRILNCMYLISGHQRNMLRVQIVLLFLSALSFYVGFSLFNDMKLSLFIFSITYSAIYAYTIIKSYLYSRAA